MARQHLALVVLAAAVDDDVLVEEGLLGLEAVEAGDVAADIADGDRQSAQIAGLVGHADPDADRVRGGGGVSHRARRYPPAPVAPNR